MPTQQTSRYIAVDLGAESGRVMVGTLSGGKLALSEAHRFPNVPKQDGARLCWQFDRLMREIGTGILQAASVTREGLRGVAVNSWGVDFGLLDAQDNLIAPPCHYRDSRTNGMLEEAFKHVPQREIYERTGIQIMQINSLYQLLAMRLQKDAALDRARRLLFMANLVSWQLGARPVAEYTLASSSQMMNMRTGQWDRTLLSRLGISDALLPEVAAPGTIIGHLDADLARQGGCEALPIVAVGSHDTASAVAAVPAEGDDWAYLSSGTWSLMGLELPHPVITDASFAEGLTNEGGIEGTIRLLKNLAGLWPVQECRRQWESDGEALSYAELTEMARRAPAFAARIDVTSADFLAPGDMPARINRHLEASGQGAIRDKGTVVRCLLEALALTYRRTLEALERVSGRRVRVIHVVGGGSQNELLCQFTADATGRTVIAGPVEATSAGNILLQAKALGELKSLAQMREVVRASFPTKRFMPRETERWEKEYARRAG